MRKEATLILWTVFSFDKLAHVNKTIRKTTFNFPVTFHFVLDFSWKLT